MIFTRDNLLEIFDYLDIKHKEYHHSGYLQICNPFVNDKKFHLGLNYNTQTYNCFKTNERGRLANIIFKLLEYHKVDLKAIKLSKASVGLDDLKEVLQAPMPEPLKEKISLPSNSAVIDINSTSTANLIFKNYLNNRKISDELISKFQLYYNISDPIYRNRVVIPYYSKNDIIFWNARDITGKAGLKYLYPKNHNKSNYLYNTDSNLNRDEIILCEGQFNAMVLDAVAVGGSRISPAQIKILKNFKAKKITVAFDQDEAGIKGTLESCKLLSQYYNDISYFKMQYLTKEDFCDWGLEKSLKFISENTKKYDKYLTETKELMNLL